MNRQDLDLQVAYGRWANRRLLQAASALAPAQFFQDLRGSFASIHGTFVHLLWAEWTWLCFWRTGGFVPEFTVDEFPSLAALEARWAELDHEQHAFFSGLEDDDLASPVALDEFTYALGDLVQHMLTHSTHHRGQIVLLIRQLDLLPPDTHFQRFLMETRHGVAVTLYP